MISYSQFAQATGISRRNCIRAIQNAEKMNIISVKKDTPSHNKYRFNKDFELWKGSVKKDTVVSKKTSRVVSKKRPTIDIKQKIVYNNRFETFWNLYPVGKKFAKQKCLKLWIKLKPDEILFNEIISALNQHTNSERWKDAQYIPKPFKWIDEERWNEELPERKDAWQYK